jgi:predicted SprT family Zn-dependent metalloprotease
MNIEQEITQIVKTEVIRAFGCVNVEIPCDYSVEFIYNDTKGGSCKTRFVGDKLVSAVLTFNVPLYERNKDTFINTIRHEIAHFIQRHIFPNAKQAHGPEWRKICKIIGCDGSRTHSYDCDGLRKKAVKRHFYSCGCGVDHILSTTLHNRASSGIAYSCRTCKGVIFYKETKVLK